MSLANKLTVLVLNKYGKPVGAAWVATEGNIVTCAHVVNNALGRNDTAIEKPQQSEEVTIYLFEHNEFTQREKICCEVITWKPAKKTGLGNFTGDVAILKPKQRLEYSREQTPVLSADPSKGQDFQCWGFPKRFSVGKSRNGTIGDRVDERCELLPLFGEKALEPGFSGSPVFSEKKILGIAVSTSKDDSISYLIPIDKISKEDWLPNKISKSAKKHTHVSTLLKHLSRNDKRVASDHFDIRAKNKECFSVTEYGNGIEQPAEYGENDLNAAQFCKRIDYPSLIMVTAPGGGGKTHFLYDVVYNLASTGAVLYWLDLAEIAKMNPSSEEELFGSTIGNFEYLKKKLDEDNSEKVFVVADGLNESSQNREEILSLLINLHKQKCITVIIGARLIKQPDDPLITFSTMVPLPKNVIKRYVQKKDLPIKWLSLLGSPFFLSIYLKILQKNPNSKVQRHSLLNEYFTELAFNEKTLKDKIKKIAETAFKVYEKVKSRTAPRNSWLDAGLCDDYFEQLKESGTLRVNDEFDEGLEYQVEFSHQLFHDWLTALHVANTDSLWSNANFDVITLKKASLEAVSLAAEIARENGKKTDFLVAVYDWDYRAVLKILLDFEVNSQQENSMVEQEFRDAIFALNALRASDVFRHSRDGVKEFLLNYEKMPNSIQFGTTPSSEQVINDFRIKYSGIDTDDARLLEFRRIFLGKPICELDEAAQIEVVDCLLKDPVIGWTTANKLRLNSLPNSLILYILGLYSAARIPSSFKNQESIGVRWRIAHLLGSAVENSLARTKLLHILFDCEEDHWVKFGAARSLMEHAYLSSSGDVRRKIISKFCDDFSKINSSLVRNEILKTTRIASDMAKLQSWNEHVELLVRSGLDFLKDKEGSEKELWKERLLELESEKL